MSELITSWLSEDKESLNDTCSVDSENCDSVISPEERNNEDNNYHYNYFYLNLYTFKVVYFMTVY